MSIFTRITDFAYTIRFLRLLTTPWEKTGAYKLGLIDEEGQKVRAPETSEEKSAYNYFHRLVFNIKRMLNMVPFGKTTVASYVAALMLLKEHTRLSDSDIEEAILEATGHSLSALHLTEARENRWNLSEDGQKIIPGTYTLLDDVPLKSTGEVLALKNTRVKVTITEAVGHVWGIPVFQATHIKTGQTVYVSATNLLK